MSYKGSGKRKRKKRKPRLPNRLLIIPNEDKKFHEKWISGRNPLNVPHPFRICCMGPPHSGKTMVIKNIILRCKPCFERIIVIHGLSDITREYDDIEPELVTGEIPPMEFFKEVDCKTLVILDDVDFKGLGKNHSHILNRLYGTLSTHNNISVILASQDFFQLPPIVRRCSNFYILWKPNELDHLSRMAAKAGVPARELNQLFQTHCKNPHDSIWIDKTIGTPFPIRFNGFNMIKKKI